MRGLYIKKPFIHLILWFSYFTLLYAVFSQRLNEGQALMVAALFAVSHVLVFYTNYGLLFPKLYVTEKQNWYVLSLVALLLLAGSYGKLIFELIWEFISTDQKYPMPPFKPPPEMKRSNEIAFFIFRNIPPFMPPLLIILVSFVVKASELSKEKQKEMEQLKAENLRSELKMLRSQINPHFLFNALNNIYSLSISKSERTPDIILKLSNMLRYVIYECNEGKVPINREIDYINNYIDLQKLKDEDIQNINFVYDQSMDTINPMLLIPFVENAFKHSKIEDVEEGWINISLQLRSGRILDFKVENSISMGSHKKDNTSGVGIENVRRRLNLLYPDKHELSFKQEPTYFKSHLKLILT